MPWSRSITAIASVTTARHNMAMELVHDSTAAVSAAASPRRPGLWSGRVAEGAARLGVVVTRRGAIRTPAFAPVATRAALKGVLPGDLKPDGFDLLLANTYHLMLRPGVEGVRKLGGVHAMLGWSRSVLTDSGGFQVYSLSQLRRIDRDGVTIRSHIDGAPLRLTPANVVAAQEAFGSDIAMVLDVCPALPAAPEALRRAVELTSAWAEAALAARRDPGMALFGIVQGGTDAYLRRSSAEALVALDFDGYAIGGLSVGESAADLYRTLDATVTHLPADRVRYLMGVGRPDNIVEAIARGIDLFDCVLPTRNARNGNLLTWNGFLSIKRAEYRLDTGPVDPACGCPTCRNYSRGTLRHLYKLGEINYVRLATVHNLWFMAELMAAVRTRLAHGGFEDLRQQIAAAYADGGEA